MSVDNETPTPGVNIALLRGINVGGKNRLPMKELAAMFINAGCEDVRTYIQSGNVVFRRDQALEGDIAKIISASILDAFGHQVSVITRTAEEFHRVVDANPFVDAGPAPDKLHVVFLADPPETSQIDGLDPNRSPGDDYFVARREVYLHCPNGFARTKLSNSYFDSRLSTTSTTRNWRTVLKLYEMCTGDA